MSQDHLTQQRFIFEQIHQIAKTTKTEIFLVGGALRDFLLDRPCLDLDFAVSHGAIKLARQFSKKIKGAFILLDEEHQCARVAVQRDQVLRTYDFADFREKDLLGDLKHRDFTINSMAVSVCDLAQGFVSSDRWIDPLGGKKDIRSKKIKMSSVRSFRDDPLRLVRAFSHQAVLDFVIEPKTLKRIEADRKLLHLVSAERMRDELFKILVSARAFKVIQVMDKLGILEQIIPQVTLMYRIPKGAYHHLPLWQHSLETFHQLEKILEKVKADKDLDEHLREPLAFGRSRYALLKLSAIIHDVGKPETFKKEQGKVSFHGHERVGRTIVRQIAKNLKLSTKERFSLEGMVLHHLRPGYLSNVKRPTAKAIFRFFRDAGEDVVSVLLLSLADQRATRGPLTTAYDQRHHEEIVWSLVEQYFSKKKEKPRVRLLSGYDLIKKLKLSPSPLFKKILTAVEEEQALGRITSKQQALDIAKRMVIK